MAKKRVYVESSVFGWLTAKPNRDIIKQAKQLLTQEWWEQRDRWDLFISPTVLEECMEGNQVAAGKRMEKASPLPVLPNTPEIYALAALLKEKAQIPDDSAADAMHLAVAAYHQMDYLATWNQTHLDNPHLREKIEKTIKEWKLKPAAIMTPERLLEDEND